MSYPRYPEYKDSGVEWLGEVPSHWEIFSGRRIFENRRELALNEDEQLAASQKYGVIPQTLMMQMNDSKVMLALKGTDSFRHVQVNDFVISLRSFEGGIEYSAYTGCVSPAYTVLAPMKPINSSYFKYLFKSRAFVSELQSTTDSLRDGKSITFQQFGAIPIGVPPKNEQQLIASFLDRETSNIDALIAEQQRLIELLKEKRQTVISHAVTKGLDPNAKMKDSGVEWLGMVPEGWEVAHLKRRFNIVGGSTPKSENSDFWDGDVVWVTPGDLSKVESIYICDSQRKITKDGLSSCGTSLVPPNTIVLSTRAPIGTVAIASVPLCTNQGCKSLVSIGGIESKYFWYLLSISTKELNIRGKGTTFLEISADELGVFKVPFPAEMEQKQICEYLDFEVGKIVGLIGDALKTIVLLQERRTAVISAAVTGKIDVRAVEAPSSPGPFSRKEKGS